MNRPEGEKYGDLRVSLEEEGIVLFNDDYFARFQNGGSMNDNAIDVLYMLAGQEDENFDNPVFTSVERIPEVYDVRDIVNEVYFHNTGPSTWRYNAGARMALFTDEDGRLPEETREEVPDLIDNFLQTCLRTDEWIQDISETATEYRKQGMDDTLAVRKATKDVAKSYPQKASTIRQYLSGHTEELKANNSVDEELTEKLIQDLELQQEQGQNKEVNQDNEDWPKRKSEFMNDVSGEHM